MKKTVPAVLLLLLLMLTACAKESNTEQKEGAKSESKQLVLVDWGGEGHKGREEAYIKRFEKEYGVKVISQTPPDYGKLKAMVDSGNVEWDVVSAETEFVPRGVSQGLLEKLDYSVIDKTDILPWTVDEYGVGAEIYSRSIAYNTDMIKKGEHPKNWTEFWDTDKYPGKRAMWDYPVGLLEIALMADGVKPTDIYPMDIDRAFNSLDKIKEHIIWWSSGAEPIQLLASGEVPLADAWNGRVVVARQDGAPMDIEYAGSTSHANSWVIPKGAKNKELAMQFIAFMTTAESTANYSMELPYIPVNTKAKEMIDDEKALAEIEAFESKSDTQVAIDSEWWFENFDSVNERFQQWLLK
ncbi:ABC transporter substrate-binding protein [Bacillus sp. JJ1503]|uniref:ABC transporter substrate-binding protein n=1 Tax=Bacillus sp. JJ1503 TaxID=3122956 RepID=UPI0030005578